MWGCEEETGCEFPASPSGPAARQRSLVQVVNWQAVCPKQLLVVKASLAVTFSLL